MRNMFDSYSNLSDIYIPNNSEKNPYEYIKFDNNIVKKDYNIKGDFVGYSWACGSTFILPYNLNKIIKVEEDALVYCAAGELPDENTVGVKGQRAYNCFDIKSWTCETLDQTTYIWKEDNEFTYPLNGTKQITLVTEKDIAFKTVIFTIKNFRHEVVHSKEYTANDVINIDIDKELSNKLIEGSYICYIDIKNGSDYKNCSKFNITISDSNIFKNNLGEIIF